MLLVAHSVKNLGNQVLLKHSIELLFTSSMIMSLKEICFLEDNFQFVSSKVVFFFLLCFDLGFLSSSFYYRYMSSAFYYGCLGSVSCPFLLFCQGTMSSPLLSICQETKSSPLFSGWFLGCLV